MNYSEHMHFSWGKDQILQDLRREALKESLRQKKEEMRREQDKLNSSLTTALVKSEEAILSNKKWMEEIKVRISYYDDC